MELVGGSEPEVSHFDQEYQYSSLFHSPYDLVWAHLDLVWTCSSMTSSARVEQLSRAFLEARTFFF